jgi:predicted RNA-binding Zn-ribbon protein involved in translation (DUF1610 family)
MDLREIEIMLAKLAKIGVGSCESCNKQLKISEFDVYNGVYLCPECIRKVSWKKETIVELPS